MMCAMRLAPFLLLATAALAQAPVTTMSEFMLKVIYPYSDAIFYVEIEPPKNEVDWGALESKALALAESGNVLLPRGKAFLSVKNLTEEQWTQDAQLLINAATKAFRGAKARDLKAIADLNAEMYEACQSCHEHFRRGYRRRP
jgi:hypothetical protein